MSRHEIEIEGLPEGLEPQEIRKPRLDDVIAYQFIRLADGYEW